MDEIFLSPMREFMLMTENLGDQTGEATGPVAAPRLHEPEARPAIIEDLHDLVFKLRAFTESRQGDIGFGVELGMQRAADMIERVLARQINQSGD